MAEIDNGGLSFKGSLDNSQINAAIEETLRRIQGYSDAVAGTGDVMDTVTAEIVECVEVQKEVIEELEQAIVELDKSIEAIEPGDGQIKLIEEANAARTELENERKALVDLENELRVLQGTSTVSATSLSQIRQVLGEIGDACEIHEVALRDLGAEYDRLGKEASEAFLSGRDEEYRALSRQQESIGGEITLRKALVKELADQSNALESQAMKVEESRKKAEDAAQAHVSFRTQLQNIREEMVALEQAGQKNTDRYRELEKEAGSLAGTISNVNKQTQILGHNESGFQGVISALSGVSGGFSAATGAISLFAGENDDLQKIMVKVQSLMAITIGLQQVQQTLNEKSAFQLVTMNGLKEWWNGLVAKAAIVETTETAATVANTTARNANTAAVTANTVAESANTVATGAQAAAATAGTAANLGLAGAFRLVGLAIKSIPVFGWVIAGISALVGLVSHFSAKAREAKKAQEEFNAAIIETAYKPIGAIENLSTKWNQLGNDLVAKKRFVEENRKVFEELGLAVRDVVDAERLLNSGKDAFVAAQIAKAKALIYVQQSTERIRKQMELEAEIANMSDTRTTFISNGMFGGTYLEVENTAKTKKQKELQEITNEIKKGYENAAIEESNALKNMTELGIDAVNTYRDGTIGAMEQAISDKKEALKSLSDPSEIRSNIEETKKMQKELDLLLGNNNKPKPKKEKDPFLENLEKQKAEYDRFLKWVNSGDETLVKAAKQEFEHILSQGATYIDYLKNQRTIIESIDVSNRTAEQNAQLRTLNNQIAEETRKTVLESFNAELADQLSNAKTISQMLDVIEQRREELSGDGTELDNFKKEALDSAEKDVVQKSKDETDALLADYASYLDKKIMLDRQYAEDLILLRKRLDAAETDEDRQSVQSAIDNRTRQYQNDIKNNADTDYTALLADYGNFEQKKQNIIDEYDEKRRIASQHGNEQLIQQLNEAQAKAISSLASSELTSSDMWASLFGNLDELATSEIETLINEIERQFDTLSDVFNPIDLDKVRTKLNEAKAVLIQDNPFKQVGVSLQKIFNDAGDDSKDSATKIKKNWKELGDATESSFDFIEDAISSCDFLKDAIGDVGATAISSLSMVAATSIAVAAAIKSAERASVILAIIQAALVVVQAVANVVKSIFGNKDKQIERGIQQHADAVDRLEAAYTALSWAIDKALGNNVYRQQQAAIANMEAQRAHLQAMWQAEQSKKKTDSGKVNEYKDQYEQLGRDIQDMLESITNDLLQTDAKTFAGELGDALVAAFSKGENAANAFGDTVDNVIKNAVLNQLKKNFLETQLQGALDNLEKSMGYWNGDNFVFDGLTDAEIAAFKNQVANITNGFNQAMDAYSDIFKDVSPEEFDTSLTGAVKGVTEETASLLAGQINAIRINQIESAEVLRQQLINLAIIAQNTSYNRFIESIYNHLRQNSNDPLRSKGLSG